ncbi:hypothetical protein TSOC_004860 [Tetrabaena socialis]|uniref:WD repeat domain-containing protein n=1 Tax=Tetrabaena socialis TaxID=47790 RepID=A0A2J8A7Q1_9CHLO|nr:hypothetical protein TSOC_004860 [Tetrabaena socialis]|eukprot:PNH08562.1 hypothetical protein TSOC_004860 [Tetrabaena socialis]
MTQAVPITESVPGGPAGMGHGGTRGGRGSSASGGPGRNSYVPKYSSEPQSGTDAINQVWVWNMDSCAPKRRMVAPGTASRPANERAVEALGFLSGPGRLRSVLVAVGADRWMRLWDVLDGTLLAERFTGHRQSETVQALALDGTNTRIATGDSGGMIKVRQQRGGAGRGGAAGEKCEEVWDISRFSGGPLSQAAAAIAIREVALWRGHSAHVTSLDWVVLEAPPATAPGSGSADGSGRPAVFLISSSADCTVTLWSDSGVRVGTFGQNTWGLQERNTWVDQETIALDERDTWIMEASRVIPRTQPQGPEPAADADGSAPGPRPLSPVLGGAASGGPGGARPDSAMPGEIALVCETSFAQRAERRSSVRRMMSTSTRASSLTGMQPQQQHPPQQQQQQQLGAGGAGGAPLVPSSRTRSAAPPGSAAAAATAAAVAAAAGADGGSGGGAAPSERSLGLRRSISVVARAECLVEESNSEEDQGESSATSGDHDSDGEVPAALWLHDFDAARNRRLPAEGSGGAGGGGGMRGYGGAGRAGVAHLVKLTELAALQERPPTSYMSSRRGVATAAGVLTQAHGSPTRPGTSTSVSSARRRP